MSEIKIYLMIILTSVVCGIVIGALIMQAETKDLYKDIPTACNTHIQTFMNECKGKIEANVLHGFRCIETDTTIKRFGK